MPAGQGFGAGIETITAATVRSSIIALNSANFDPDVLGSFTSAGFNLIGKAGASTGFTAATDQTGTVAAPLDPKLDPILRDNGGPTQTIALFLGGPAIDKGTSTGLSGPLTTDQRGTGFARTFDDPSVPDPTGGDGTDIGAFELQSGCNFSIAPASQNIGVSGSTGSVNITANDSACSWTALSNSSFITLTSGSSGQGNGAVGFTVAANPNSDQRTGTMTIAGKTFTVTQDGTNCSYSIAPTAQSLDAAASTNVVNVTASAGCAWTATNNDPSFLGISSGASGSGNGVVTYTIAANSTTAQRIGTLTIAGQTFTVTQAGIQPTLLANISTRLRVETGDNVLIGGFIITGTEPKKVIVRGIGTSLPLPDKLADPTLELHGPNGLIEANDNWVDSPNKPAIIDSTIPPSSDLESAIVATLPANGTGYTAIVRGVNNGTGIGVVEAYDLNTAVDSRLANISTRGFVQIGDNVLIAGTIVVGQTPQKVIIRAIGPSLSIAGRLENPTLELHDQNGALLQENDNWVDSPNKQAIIDSTVPPTNDLESAIVATLPANGASYTAIVRGANNTTGIAVVEVYALD
jgi:hypothetical protein